MTYTRRAVFALASIVMACLCAPAWGAKWHMAETDSFRIYSSGSTRDLRKLAQTLEDFDGLLRFLTGLEADPPPNKFDLYLVKKGKTLRRYTGLEDSVYGYYTATPTGTAAFSSRSRKRAGDPSKNWSFSSQQVLFHEYAHHFMLRHFPYAYPPWYVEGFAEYVSTVQIKDTQFIVGDFALGRAYSLAYGKKLALKTIMSPLKRTLEGDERSQFYAQSWLLTHYLFRHPVHAKQLPDFLKMKPSPDTLEEAVETAFGVTIEDLERTLENYGSKKGERMTVSTFSRPKPDDIDVAITRLPKSADDALLLSVKLDIGINEPFQALALKDADALKTRYPKDYLALRTWAHAQILYGAPLAGRSVLEDLAGQYPQDAKLRYYLGMSYVQDAYAAQDANTDPFDALAAARKHFVKAYALNKAHYPTLYYYYLSLPKPASDADARTLEEAEFLAPQVAEIRFNLAQLWLSRDVEQKRVAAVRLLRILASDPHGGLIAQLSIAHLKALETSE